MHSPVSLRYEERFDEEFKSWLSFAEEKVTEVVSLAKLFSDSEKNKELLEKNQKAIKSRRESTRIHKAHVQKRFSQVKMSDAQRHSAYPQRRTIQEKALKLPLLPTTTIGSFPQTKEIRNARKALKEGTWTESQYHEFIKKEIKRVVDLQEKLEIDVLVHGEAERNDMVEYFGENFAGFAFSENGWVQSYGSRCVKPPIIFGDVEREKPITVEWSKYAQSLTKRLMKGMLTGPVTILQWSFVREDQPRRDTTYQIALALRDEVIDLEKAGIKVIQIDEPAYREGLPLRNKDQAAYLNWASEAFRLSASGVKDETQIHTHMCYCEFNDIMPNIASLDADVISIEASRSEMELLNAFEAFHYPNEIGPGVWDIHSPRVPSKEEIVHLLEKAIKVLPPQRLWVNPDCGLKTRAYPETTASLTNLMAATKEMRQQLNVTSA
jgi:5-methyltetrahydropteroyltriglutamate--homocysteine methyltransferase